MRSTPADDGASERAATPPTRRPGALVHVEALLHLPVSVWGRVVVDRRPACRNRLREHPDDPRMETGYLCRRQPVDGMCGMQLRPPERLIGVDVSDPRDHGLIQQGALDAGVPRPKHLDELLRIKQRV